MVLSDPNWNFGKVWDTDKPGKTIAIRNFGAADLVIKEVKSNCGCTAAQPSRNVIPPGQEATLQNYYDPHGKQGDTGSKVTILTNDPALAKSTLLPDATEYVFEIKGFVQRAVVLSPAAGLFIRTRSGAPGQTAVARLDNQMPEPMKPRIVKNTVPWMDFDLREVNPSVSCEIEGRLSRPLKPGRYRGTLVVATGLSRDAEYTVSVRARVLDAVEVEPPVVMPTDGRGLGRGPLPISLHYYGDRADFAITAVECSNPAVQVTYSKAVPASAQGLERIQPPIKLIINTQVTAPPVKDIPSQGITVKFRTNDPACPVGELLLTNDRAAFDERMLGVEGTPR
jgi:hypothetical protein